MENSNLDILLCDLSDRHFSFFYTFRKSEFSEEFQSKIELEKVKRKLSLESISKYIKEKKAQSRHQCLRCQSHLRFEEIDRIPIVDVGSFFIDIHSWKCIVCGFNPNKDKPLNWKMWLMKKINMFNKRSIVRLNN